MPVAIILAMCLLPWPHGGLVTSLHASPGWQSVQKQPSDTSPQSSPTQPQTAQAQTRDQSASAPQPSPEATLPCPDKSQPGSAANPDCKPAESPGAHTRKHRRTRKTVTPPEKPAEAGPTKTVVRNGGASDPTVDLSPGLSQQQASHQIEITNQLLANSDANLNKISGHQLSVNQQDTVNQIKSYLEQAKKAVSDGDLQRAHNLAAKANLLSTELAGH